jgi:hypothetical protein
MSPTQMSDSTANGQRIKKGTKIHRAIEAATIEKRNLGVAVEFI